jgi:stearoyl-CoA desaturase (delta-9 desaturase)
VLWSFVWSLLASALVTQVAVFSTTIFLHRCATHKALDLHPGAAFVFRFAIWLTTGVSTREWVAVHGKHHAFTEVEGDPHSPHLHGFWSVQLGNVFHYLKESRNPETLERYARDIEEDWWDRWVFKIGIVGPIIGVVGLCLILGLWWGLFAAALHLFMYVFVLSSSINGLCHYIGYRNFDNTATNIRLVALLTGGEGLHNNHHGHPRSPKFSFRPREIDPSWPLIRLLAGLKLARPYKTIEEIQGN